MKELVKVCKNGTKVWKYSEQCWKCNGTGTYHWGAFSGICYQCNGTGIRTWKENEYTPEHEAELLAKHQKEADERAKKYADVQEQREEVQRQIEAQKAVSQHQGEIGQKITVRITEDRTVYYDTQYGEMHIHIMKDADGNVYTWKTSNSIGWYDDEERWIHPDEYTVTGTVKEHNTYDGEKQTVLTRCKFTQ